MTKLSALHPKIFNSGQAVLFIRVHDLCCYFVAVFILGLMASSANADSRVEQVAPRSVLILDQSTSFRPWPTAIIAGIRSVFAAHSGSHVAIYVEHLDLHRFRGSEYLEDLHRHFSEKYRDRVIDVIVTIGPRAFEYGMPLRGKLWPTVPVVFAAVPDQLAPNPPPGVTGTTEQMNLANLIKASRILDPTLKRFAIVGDRLDTHPHYYPLTKELPTGPQELEFIDLTGRSIREVRDLVAALPDHTTILYIGINADPEGMYVAADILPRIAETANRPIIVDAETYFGTGATGGLIVSPQHIGQAAGHLVLRILQGENASNIPVAQGDPPKPVFDWRQLHKWNISEDRLPPGSEVRFRQPSAWQQYRSQILAAATLVLFQFGLIILLLGEHRRRHRAEIATRNTMSQLAQVNRLATAGELSASIAHEVNQPLTGIVTKANAALRWLAVDKPDLEKARAALTQIVSAGHRASNIITSIRSILRKETQEKSPVDINKLIWMVLGLVWIDLRKHEIDLDTKLYEQLPSVWGNQIQLQQVILNLITNAIESMHSVEQHKLRVRSEPSGPDEVHVSIEDTGTGIEHSNLDNIFKPMFTTKATGMGMGLAICRSIIEGHGGRIWISRGSEKGSAFHFTLPTQH
jgi:signal transduction histidine kinase